MAATQLDLIPPSGTLNRGDTIQFTVTVDTEGANVPSLQVGLEYDSVALQYIGTTPGDTYQTIAATPLDSKRILISASSPVGASANGNLAYVDFKIIATSSGTAELCTLFVPDSPAPTGPGPTSAPQITSLPQTGESGGGPSVALFGTALLLIAGGLFVAGKKRLF